MSGFLSVFDRLFRLVFFTFRLGWDIGSQTAASIAADSLEMGSMWKVFEESDIEELAREIVVVQGESALSMPENKSSSSVPAVERLDGGPSKVTLDISESWKIAGCSSVGSAVREFKSEEKGFSLTSGFSRLRRPSSFDKLVATHRHEHPALTLRTLGERCNSSSSPVGEDD
jgi:hypothetical protein